MSGLKELILKMLYPNKYSSEAYVKYLRKMGAKIGRTRTFMSLGKRLLIQPVHGLFVLGTMF